MIAVVWFLKHVGTEADADFFRCFACRYAGMENDPAFVVKQEREAGIVDPHGLYRGCDAVEQGIHAQYTDQHAVIINRHHIGDRGQFSQKMGLIGTDPAGSAFCYRFEIPGAVFLVGGVRPGGNHRIVFYKRRLADL